jgi:hypothetical protein
MTVISSQGNDQIKKDREPRASNPWKTLMEGLYYPAVLGAGFLVFVEKILTHHTQSFHDVTFWFAAILIFYFSVSFLMTHEVPDAYYNLLVFFCDALEIIFVVAAFAALGFADLTEPAHPDLATFYKYLASIAITELAWQIAAYGCRLFVPLPAVGALFVLTVGYNFRDSDLNADWKVMGALILVVILHFLLRRRLG